MYIPSMIDSDGAGIISAIASASGSFNYTGLASTSTEENTKDAINTFVIRMKNAGLWSKSTVLYGYLGGNAAGHAINWKTPGTYNLTWNGTLTHSTSGTAGDGSTGYGIIPVSASSLVSISGGSMDIYCRTASSTIGLTELGCNDGSTHYIGLYTYASSLTTAAAAFGDNLKDVSGTISSSAGFLSASRTSSSLLTLYKNGASIGTNTSTVATIPAVKPWVHAMNNNGSITSASPRVISFARIGSALTSSDELSLYTIVQELQTRLGRAV